MGLKIAFLLGIALATITIAASKAATGNIEFQRNAAHQAGHLTLGRSYQNHFSPQGIDYSLAQDLTYTVTANDEDELQLALMLTQAGNAAEELYGLPQARNGYDDEGALMLAKQIAATHPDETPIGLINHAREQAKAELESQWSEVMRITCHLLQANKERTVAQ